MSDKTKSELVIKNIQLEHWNRELEALLAIRKCKSFSFRLKCAFRELVKEFYGVG